MTFSERSRRRCESPTGFAMALSSWSLSDWATATLGELGESANLIKKLNRIREGARGNDATETKDALEANLKDELADTRIYLDLLCQAAGFDLDTITEAKFQKTSAKIGYLETCTCGHDVREHDESRGQRCFHSDLTFDGTDDGREEPCGCEQFTDRSEAAR